MRPVNSAHTRFACKLRANKGFPAYISHMILLEGKVVAAARQVGLQKRISEFSQRYKRAPALAVVLVGEDPASQVYVRNKIKNCETLGIRSVEKKLSEKTSQSELLEAVEKLNADSQIDGILVQLPLPKHITAEVIIEKISPAKDADGLTVYNQGRLFKGEYQVAPCTPFGVMKMLEHYKIDLRGKNAVVIGRSHIVGRPMAELLTAADATVTICHSRTKDMPSYTKAADVVVVAAGKPQFIGKEFFKKGAVVVDVGIHRLVQNDGKAKIVGDVNSDSLDGWLAALSPVPGGVGPMTIAMLLENTVTLAEARANK